ncbi:hypothetical protein F5B20DRAFT_453991 [Whalleya microplaca]|nr:hypothetical protein F5B20DRAFT_453991 [Whalleya microplaca]
MINEIVKNSGNEKNIQLVVERGFEEVRRRILRPYSPIESEELDQRSAVNSGAVPQQLRINQPCPRHTANPPPRHSSQSTFTAPNIGGTTSQVEDRPTERYVEVPSYLPLLDPATPFPIDRSYGSYSDPYSADISNSGFLSVQQAGSNMFTAGTSLSDYDSTGRGLYDGSSNVWPISHQSSSPVQQLSAYPRPNSNIGYPHGTMRHINNEDSAIGHVDPSVPSGSYEQQPGAAVAGQINTTQLPESTPGGGSDEHDSVSGPSQAYWYGQGPASQG